MEKKLMFNKIVEDYEKYRPLYTPQVFEEIIEYGKLCRQDKVIEIGCGTGQATKTFLDMGCDVTAIEIGNELAKYTRDKYKDSPNLKVINKPFEDYTDSGHKYDLIFSATAFHWIPRDLGYVKALNLLKTGGTLALFWNRPSISKENEDLESKIEDLYTEYLGNIHKKRKSLAKTDLYSQVQNDLSIYGFEEIELRTFQNKRTLSSWEYTGLLETYSDHMSIPDKIRRPFYKSIRRAIEANGDGIEIVNDIDLHLARKVHVTD